MEYCLYIYENGRYADFKYDRASRFYISNVNMDDKNDFAHPTIKPLQMVTNHILNSCEPGGSYWMPLLALEQQRSHASIQDAIL